MADRAGIINATTGGIVPVNNALVEVSPGVWSLQATAPGYVPESRTISTTAPLTGGGDLSANRTIAMPAATSVASGYMTAAMAAIVAGFSTFGKSLGAAVDAAAAKALLALVKADVGLGNVDNTSDVNKPVSTAQATADELRVLKAGDTMTGPFTLAAGTTAAGTAPLKIPSGPLMLTPEAGAVERLVDKLYLTIATGTSRKPIALWDSSGTTGRIPFTTTDGRLLDATNFTRNSTTGDVTLGSGANLVLSGGTTLGAGNIVMAAVASALFDNNLVVSDATNKTMGFVCGATAAFAGAYGPFFGLRGNTFIGQPNQRGNIFVYAGRPSAPGATEGTVVLGTNDIARITIAYGGTVTIWSAVTMSTSCALGGGTPITKIVVYTPTLTPALIAGFGLVEQTFTVTGLAVTDTVSLNGPAPAAGTAPVAWRVSAADTLAISFQTTAINLTPSAGAYRILAHRS